MRQAVGPRGVSSACRAPDRQAGRGRLAVIVLAALTLGACAEVQFLSQATKVIGVGSGTSAPNDPNAADNGERYKVGNAYQIKGVWYYPAEDSGYVEEGIASWYGPNFHGKLTANGAIFDMYKVSAAHRTLPMPSMVRVTNLENGRSLKVKVNDRGPFARNRIIDLSMRAAELLGFQRQGTALVRVEVLAQESQRLAALMKNGGSRSGRQIAAVPDEPPPPEAAPAPDVDSETLAPPPGVEVAEAPSVDFQVANRGKPISPDQIERQPVKTPESDKDVTVVSVPPNPDIFIQAGAFAEHVNAVRAQALLRSVGPVVVEQINRSSTPLFRVRVGPVANTERADQLLTSIQNAGFEDAQIVVNR